MDANNVFVYFIGCIFLYSLYKKHNAFESFINGVKKGILTFFDIFPTMVAMFCVVSLLKESHLLIDICLIISRYIKHIPSSIWPLVIFRPISGSASLALYIDLLKSHGPDTLVGVLASVIQSSTDTTIYVISLYFGCIGVQNSKNALFIGIITDMVGISIAILLVLLFYSW